LDVIHSLRKKGMQWAVLAFPLTLQAQAGPQGGFNMKKRNERGIFLALALLLAVVVFASITAFTPPIYRTTYVDGTAPPPGSPDIHSRGSQSSPSDRLSFTPWKAGAGMKS
jgi:hypothetical protein